MAELKLRAQMAELLLDSLVPLAGGSNLEDYASILAKVAAALRLRDTRPAALAVAAGAAAAATQQTQDEEEEAFEASTQVAAQVEVARRAVEALEGLAAALDATAGEVAEEARGHAESAVAKRERIRKYEEQQRQITTRLQAVGCCPEIGQAHLQALGRERGQALAELARVEAELQRYRGLPADMAAARTAMQEKRQELQRLRQRLQQHLDAMS